jgi:membrane associated rhomboid family serine protease
MNYENYRPSGYRLLPDVVKNLLIINVIMYLATQLMLSRGIDLTDILGLHYFAADKFRIYQFITYMFMHDYHSFMHIFLNMFALYMFGSVVENVWGPKKFLTYYVLTGLGAAVAHYAIVYFQMQPTISFLNDYINSADMDKMNALVNSNAFGSNFTPEFRDLMQSNPSQALTMSIDVARQFKTEILNAPVVIGASGAVYGVLLAYGMLFPNSLLYLFFAIPVKAKYVVIAYGVIELYSGISGHDNVAHFAHLGGLVTGIIIILYWRIKNRRRRDDFFNQG